MTQWSLSAPLAISGSLFANVGPDLREICAAEERDLVTRCGKAYEEYRARTDLVLPRRSYGDVWQSHLSN